MNEFTEVMSSNFSENICFYRTTCSWHVLFCMYCHTLIIKIRDMVLDKRNIKHCSICDISARFFYHNIEIEIFQKVLQVMVELRL